MVKKTDESEEAFCKLFKCTVKSKVYNFAHHESSSKHKAKIINVNQSNLKSFVSIEKQLPKSNENIKRAEINLAVAVTWHSAIAMAIDHLSEIIGNYGKGSVLETLKLRRTKCTQIIKNVICVALREDLKKDIKDKKFVLLIDESTDIAIQKHLRVMVRYFSESVGCKTAFLGLVPVSSATAQRIYDELKIELGRYDMMLENCIGFSSDGAATMVGKKNSVWTRIKEVSPNCVQMKCICHSLALCIQYAFEKLPSSLGFIITEIPLWLTNTKILNEDKALCIHLVI